MENNLAKIFIVLLLTGGIIVGTAYFVNKNSKPNNLSASLLKSFADKDSDKDGLSDNMESIYGTNYSDPDSDGDGYLDGEEVLSGYDPLKPAPNDQLNSQYAVVPRPAAGSMKDLNFTTDLVNQLTQKIVSGGIQPQSYDDMSQLANPATVEEALEGAIARSYQEFSLPNIPSDQLNISLDNSKEAIQKYAGEIAKILAKMKEISVFDLDDKTKNIADAVELCESIAAGIKKLKVPSNLVSVHKKQIGFLAAQANVLKAIVSSEEDPLKMVIAFSRMKDFNNVSAEILNEIEKIQ